ncbi:hypothetical protein AB1L12_04660 [Peribacillus frigoritolerans]|uniref:hypothetical protein n=1 Tax=Peribacillus frigoritolerans TaxID=450367 RepID=UPI0039A1E9F3
MNKILIPYAISTFFSSTPLIEYLAMRTAQDYVEDLKLLQDVDYPSMVILKPKIEIEIDNQFLR